MLRFRMLGAFEAYRGDERIARVAWRTRHAQSVLEILLDQRGRPVPFERLADLVWPEADPAAARNSLQAAVGTIRRVLEPDLRSGNASRYVRTDGSAYRFATDGCAIDVDEFAHERERALAAERSGDRDRAIASFRAALALYRGDYLADDPQVEWLLGPREQLRESVLDVVERLARALVALGQNDEAVAAAERGLAIDPLREELYQAAMRAHLAAGRRSHALAVYERCRRILLAEIGVEPSGATRGLRDASATTTAPRQTAAPAQRGQVDIPFVGRSAELAALRSAWERAEHERGVVALVHGPAGVGKTRLARELADALGPQVRTLWMTAHEPEAGMSYAPILALVASWLDRGSSVGQLRRLGPHAPVLAHLLPQVRASWPECPPLEVSTPDPGQVLEALTRAVTAIGAAGRALIVIDDVHWADDATLLWLGYLPRRLLAGVMVLLARRTGERDAPALDARILELRTGGLLTDVTLGPLSRADVELLVNAAADGIPVASDIAGRIHAASNGYPLFAVELLREMRHRGDLSAPDLHELPIPTSVRETIALRAARLEPADRDTLVAISVLGLPSTATLLATATRQDLDATLASLEGLLERQLIRTSEDGHRYELDHPLVGRVVYEGLLPPRRLAWHRRAADAIAEHVAALPASAAGQILRHLIAADARPDELVATAERVGEGALRRYAYAEAVAAFEIARDQLASASFGPEAAPRRAHATLRLGEALHGAARWDEAVACYRELLDAADDPLERSRLRRRIAQVLGDVGGRFGEALTLLDEAEAELPSAGDDARLERGHVEAARTVALFYRSEYHDAVERGERALELWDGRDDVSRETMEQLNRIALSEQRIGRLDRAEPRLRRALAVARRVGDRLAEARYVDNLSGVLLQRGAVGASLELQADAMRLYAETGVPKFEMIGLVNHANKLTARGDLPAARRAYEDAIALSETLRARYTTMHALVGMGEVLVRLGESGAARRALRRGIALAEEIGNRQRLAHAHVYLGELALTEGVPGEAKGEIEQALAIGGPIDDSHTVREGCPILARALLALGDTPAAEAAARRGLARASAGGFGVGVARNRVALAEALWRLGDAGGARAELDAAIATFRSAPARYDLALALFVRATTVLGRKPRAAEAALSEALALARDCGARPLTERIGAAHASHMR